MYWESCKAVNHYNFKDAFIINKLKLCKPICVCPNLTNHLISWKYLYYSVEPIEPIIGNQH